MNAQSYDQLLNRLEKAAEAPAVSIARLGRFGSIGRSYEMVALEMGAPGPGKHQVLVSAGIHGDEPASVEAAVRFVEQNARNEELFSRFFFVVFPCI